MKINKVRAFDFCKTLVDCNSTFEFMKYYANSRKWFFFKFYSLCVISKVLLSLKIISESTFTKIRVFSFRGEQLSEVLGASKLFSELLNERLIIQPMKTFESSIELDKSIIISNSFDFLIKDFIGIRGLCGIDVIASSLEHKNGSLSGRYRKYILDDGKVSHLAELYPEYEVSEYWTDDLAADFDIVEQAKVVFYVSGKNVSRFK